MPARIAEGDMPVSKTKNEVERIRIKILSFCGICARQSTNPIRVTISATCIPLRAKI